MGDEKDKEIEQLKNASKIDSFVWWVIWNIAAVMAINIVSFYAIVGANQVILTTPLSDLGSGFVQITYAISVLILWAYVGASAIKWFVEIFREDLTKAIGYLSKIKITTEEKHD